MTASFRQRGDCTDAQVSGALVIHPIHNMLFSLLKRTRSALREAAACVRPEFLFLSDDASFRWIPEQALRQYGAVTRSFESAELAPEAHFSDRET
jgi:hypothetical protein